MKCFLGMKVMRGTLLLASAFLVFFACGRNETTAPTSAAADREAQATGTTVTGGHEHSDHEHGSHETATASGTGTMDHSAHGVGADPHAGHDMAPNGTAGHAAHGTAHETTANHGAHTATGGAMDHAQHGSTGRTTARHEAHDPTTGSAAHDQHAGMQHGTPAAAADPHAQHRQPAAPAAHAGHGATQQQPAGAPSVVLKAPTTSAEIARVQPAATLRPDDFDAPAPIAVEEARKAAGAPTSEASEEAVYTCPMHPEVTSATPGECPKCGMTLIKKEK